MDFPSFLFSSATGVQPLPVDKKKYFTPPVPAPVPSPVVPNTKAAPAIKDVPVTEVNQTTTNSNKNSGIIASGYGYTLPGGTGKDFKTIPSEVEAKSERPEKEIKTEKSSIVKSWLTIDRIVIGVVLLVIVSGIVWGVYTYAKKSK